SVEFGKRYGKLLVVAVGLVLQDAEGNLLAQQDRLDGGAAKVNAGMDPVAKRDVECQLTQFSVDGQIACVRAPVQVERMTIRVWLFDVAAGCLEQRLDPLGAVKEKFQHRDARAAHGAVTRRVAWVRG